MFSYYVHRLDAHTKILPRDLAQATSLFCALVSLTVKSGRRTVPQPDVSGQVILAGWLGWRGRDRGRRCPAHCRIYTSTFILYPVDAGSTCLPSCDKQKCLQTSAKVPWRGKLLLLGTNGLVVAPFMVVIKILKKKYFLLLFFLPLPSPPTLGLVPLL